MRIRFLSRDWNIHRYCWHLFTPSNTQGHCLSHDSVGRKKMIKGIAYKCCKCGKEKNM